MIAVVFPDRQVLGFCKQKKNFPSALEVNFFVSDINTKLPSINTMRNCDSSLGLEKDI